MCCFEDFLNQNTTKSIKDLILTFELLQGYRKNYPASFEQKKNAGEA